ncbi:MAG: hypothetical protein Q7S18_03680 [bacterium]|nr:hypothetical protein [bacterium]
MLDFKKENIQTLDINAENPTDPNDNGNVEIHTMQDDLNALSGIFSKDNKIDFTKEKKEEISKMDAAKKNDKYFNPFLDNDAAGKKYEGRVAFPEKIQTPMGDLASENNLQNEKKRFDYKFFLIWAGIPLLAVIIFSLGGYYFWSARKTATAPVALENKVETLKVEEKPQEPVVTQPEPKYSGDKPNYLSVGTDSPDFENLKKKLLEVGSEIKNLEIAKPVEFIAVDERNNPISFSIFAVLGNIKLSSNLLKALDDNFSLYIYSDEGNIRLGLVVDTKDQKQANLIIKNEESKLVGELSSLLIEGFATPKGKIVFKDNIRSEVAIRYFNLIDDHTLSVDYAFLNSKLLIGTSKNTMWSIIDKVKNVGN